jgi:outer membrane protein OmpA-like peptidoglycan-associated protein
MFHCLIIKGLFMNKRLALCLLALVGLSGCCCKRKKNETHGKVKESTTREMDVAQNTDLTVATLEDDGIKTLVFDDSLGEFTFVEDENEAQADLSDTQLADADLDNEEDFSWAEESAQQERTFKTIYFDYDRDTLRKDQEEALAFDIELAQQMFDEYKFFGDEDQKPTVVIDGHACHSAGSRAYNLAISERRAKVIANKLVEAGIPQENIKVVGRGAEYPAVVEGETVTGDKTAQWPNRRDEMRIVYS